MERTNFLRHAKVVSEAYQSLDRMCNAMGISDMDNGLVDLLNDMSAMFADIFGITDDMIVADDFHEVFWEIAGGCECARLDIYSWNDFYNYFTNEKSR